MWILGLNVGLSFVSPKSLHTVFHRGLFWADVRKRLLVEPPYVLFHPPAETRARFADSQYERFCHRIWIQLYLLPADANYGAALTIIFWHSMLFKLSGFQAALVLSSWFSQVTNCVSVYILRILASVINCILQNKLRKIKKGVKVGKYPHGIRSLFHRVWSPKL